MSTSSRYTPESFMQIERRGIPTGLAHGNGMELLSSPSNVDFLIRYACRFPRWGSVIASSAPLLIQRRTVVSSTRSRRATSRTVNSSSLFSSAISVSPAPSRCFCEMTLLLRDICPPLSSKIETMHTHHPQHILKTCYTDHKCRSPIHGTLSLSLL